LPVATTAALVPTMAARSMHGNPQLWYAGSAVDQLKHEHGVVFARVRERGMAGQARIAYFEWSVDADSPDQVSPEVREDPDAWAQANPGLGIRISVEHVGNECAGALGAREFSVERLGVGDWPPTDDDSDHEISPQAWAALEDPDSVAVDPLVFAFDVSPDRSSSAITAAGRREDGLGHVEVIDHRRGTGWVVDRLAELVRVHRPSAVVCDGRGPAGSLLVALDQAGVEVTVVNAQEHAQACGLFVDAVTDESFRHIGQDELRAALRGARKRPLGDSWAWSRKASISDISPLVAATLGWWGAATPTFEPLIEVFG
jgi:hypothetical protein